VLTAVEKFPNRPIVLIAHSLGGAVLKKVRKETNHPKSCCGSNHHQALLLAHQNLQDARFKQVVECLSGILFLGTPHTGISDEDTLLRHNQILFSCAKQPMPKRPARATRDAFHLASLGATFEQIANVPILSVFQYAETRSLSQKFLGKKSKVSPLHG
jgi:hypothetical protein